MIRRKAEIPNIPQVPLTVSPELKSFLEPMRQWVGVVQGEASLFDKTVTFRDLQYLYPKGLKYYADNGGSDGALSKITGNAIRTGKIQSNDDSTYYDLDNKKIVMNGKETYATTDAGVFLGLDDGDYKVNIGNSTNYFKFSGTNTSWAGANASLTEAGNLIASGGTIGGWDLTATLLRSATSGARIELNQDKNRVSIFDAVGEKVVMGYLEDLDKNPIKGTVTSAWSIGVYDETANWSDLTGATIAITAGTGSGQSKTITWNNSKVIITSAWSTTPDSTSEYKISDWGTWSASNYGFWAKDGDYLAIDGDVQYSSGDWIIQNDASYLIQDSGNNTIVRLGTDSGDKGLFIYDTSGTQLAKFISDELLIGDLAGEYLRYRTTHGLQFTGTFAVDSLSAISAVLGDVTTGTLTGVTITGGLFQTATSGKRISINSEGISLRITDSTGKYGEFKYGTTKYGSGVLAYIHHTSQTVPFYISTEQTVADFHFFNRSSDPSGVAEVADTCVSGGGLRQCVSAGTPGTWALVGPNVCRFLAIPASDQSNIATDSGVTVVFGTEAYDDGGDFASNTFNSPSDGVYHFDISIHLEDIDIDADYYEIRLVTTGRTYTERFDPDIYDSDGENTISFSVDADIDNGDTAYVQFYQSGGAAQTDVTTNSWFSCHAVYQEA